VSHSLVLSNADTMDKVSQHSLEVVGRTILLTVELLDKKLTSYDESRGISAQLFLQGSEVIFGVLSPFGLFRRASMSSPCSTMPS
jgi:hypothetical protein